MSSLTSAVQHSTGVLAHAIKPEKKTKDIKDQKENKQNFFHLYGMSQELTRKKSRNNS